MPDNFTELLDRLAGVRQRGDRADARCPAHPDRKSSLVVSRGEGGRVLIYCHAGCSWTDVLNAVGMAPGDAFGEPRIVREHVYTDAKGNPRYVVERWEPKTFRQRLASGARRAPKAEERVLYNLPAVLQAHETVGSVFYTEGERDADTLGELGYIATTTLGGAGKPWQQSYTDALNGLRVVIVADNDEPGKRWAHQVAKHIRKVCTPVLVVPPKGIKDVTELVEAGYPITAMVPLADTHGKVATAFDIPPKAVEWLWPGRLPANMLTLLEGDPGTGKSTLIAEIVACLTTGRALPGGTHTTPLRVAILSDEDSWPSVVVPRLAAAGADLHRVFHLEGIEDEATGFLRPYSLLDMSVLRDDLQAIKAEVFIVDPLLAYLGLDLDSHKDQHVRSVLGPLVQLAETDKVTVIAVRHFTKGSVGQRAIYRGGGSIGFTGQARVVLQVGEYPQQLGEEEQQGHYVLAVAKCNMAAPAVSLGYHFDVDERLEVARIAWEELPVPVTASQLGRPAGEEDPDTRRAGKEAVQWLEGYVTHHWHGEPLEWKAILTAAREAGIPKNTLERHRGKVLMLRIDGPGGRRAARWVPISPPKLLFTGDAGDGEMGSNGEMGEPDLAHLIDPSGYDEPEPDSTHNPIYSHFPITFVPGKPPDPVGKWDGATCSVCTSTDGIVIKDGVAYCRVHNPMVWKPPT